MRERSVRENDRRNTVYVAEFSSTTDFNEYLNEMPLNVVYANERSVSSKSGSKEFTGTESYEEAEWLMLNGDKINGAKLTKAVNAKKNDMMDKPTRKMFQDVAGFQANIPNYLTGVPQSMFNQKLVSTKKKVVTIDKMIAYSAYVSKEEIITESTKVFKLVQKIEAQGMRVNLFVTFASEERGVVIVCRVKIKSANERINIGKAAFALVNPSMLRRMNFRFIEVYPKTTKDFKYGYGKPVGQCRTQRIKDVFEKLKIDSYIIPSIVRENEENISLESEVNWL